MHEHKKEKFTFAKGTKLTIGDTTITLTEDTAIPFDGAENELMMVGLLQHSKNLDLNRKHLKHKYNGFGMPLPVEAQVPKGVELNDFIADLSENDAQSFGVSDRREQLRQQRQDSMTKAEIKKAEAESAKADAEAEELEKSRAEAQEAEIQKQEAISLRDLALKQIEHADQNRTLEAKKQAEIESDIAKDEPRVERLTEEAVKADEKAAAEREAEDSGNGDTAGDTVISEKAKSDAADNAKFAGDEKRKAAEDKAKAASTAKPAKKKK